MFLSCAYSPVQKQWVFLSSDATWKCTFLFVGIKLLAFMVVMVLLTAERKMTARHCHERREQRIIIYKDPESIFVWRSSQHRGLAVRSQFECASSDRDRAVDWRACRNFRMQNVPPAVAQPGRAAQQPASSQSSARADIINSIKCAQSAKKNVSRGGAHGRPPRSALFVTFLPSHGASWGL